MREGRPVPPLETPSGPAPARPRVLRKSLLVFLLLPALFLAVLIIAAWREELAGFFKTNYLYNLGHRKQWEKARESLNDVPVSARGAARYALVKMNILLNLSRTGEAMEYFRSGPLDSLAPSDKNRIAFEQLGGFCLILTGKDEEARQLFRTHRASRLSAAMADFLAQAGDGAEKETANPVRDADTILAMMDKRMPFPHLYAFTVRYLLARRHISRGEIAKAAPPLEEACAEYPYFPVFHRCLGRAYLAQRRYDLATMHLTMARLQIRDMNLHAYSRKDEGDFEAVVLKDAFEHAETSELSNFWRLLRGLRKIFPETLSEPPISPDSSPMSLAEIWEWGTLRRSFLASEKGDGPPIAGMSTEDEGLFLALEKATAAPAAQPMEIPLGPKPGSERPTLRILSVTPINRREAWIATDAQSLSFFAPPPRERPGDRTLDRALLFRIRATERQGVCGGCEVNVGQDSYWIYADPMPQWYAVPSPFLRETEIPLVFRFNHDFIPGYSDPAIKGDRNLMVSNIILCALVEREKE